MNLNFSRKNVHDFIYVYMIYSLVSVNYKILKLLICFDKYIYIYLYIHISR